jgi:hypothetical protein
MKKFIKKKKAIIYFIIQFGLMNQFSSRKTSSSI